MSVKNKAIVLRLMGEEMLSDNGSAIIELLKDNYMINFPTHGDLAGHITSSYDDMIKFSRDGSATIIGAFLDAEFVGFLWAYTKLFLGEPRIHISQLVVTETLRGHGVGSLMINKIQEIATQRGVEIIELVATSQNNNATRFYEKHGFNVSRVQLEKRLVER